MSNEKEKVAAIFSSLADALETGSFGEKFSIGLTIPGSEHGEAELVKAAKLAREANNTLAKLSKKPTNKWKNSLPKAQFRLR